MKLNEILQFNWMDLQNPGVSCKDLHGDTSCLYQILYNKCYKTIKASAKFYLILHMIPFLIFRLKKINDKKKLKEAIIKFIKTYVGSLLFMSTLVGGIKFHLCINNNICGDQPVFDGKLFGWGSFVSSLSLFFEDSSRRQQISFFIFVRALRSIYFFMKRRRWIYLPKQQKTAFILIFGITSYIFYHHKPLLKYANIYEKLWGQA